MELKVDSIKSNSVVLKLGSQKLEVDLNEKSKPFGLSKDKLFTISVDQIDSKTAKITAKSYSNIKNSNDLQDEFEKELDSTNLEEELFTTESKERLIELSSPQTENQIVNLSAEDVEKFKQEGRLSDNIATPQTINCGASTGSISIKQLQSCSDFSKFNFIETNEGLNVIFNGRYKATLEIGGTTTRVEHKNALYNISLKSYTDGIATFKIEQERRAGKKSSTSVSANKTKTTPKTIITTDKKLRGVIAKETTTCCGTTSLQQLGARRDIVQACDRTKTEVYDDQGNLVYTALLNSVGEMKYEDPRGNEYYFAPEESKIEFEAVDSESKTGEKNCFINIPTGEEIDTSILLEKYKNNLSSTPTGTIERLTLVATNKKDKAEAYYLLALKYGINDIDNSALALNKAILYSPNSKYDELKQKIIDKKPDAWALAEKQVFGVKDETINTVTKTIKKVTKASKLANMVNVGSQKAPDVTDSVADPTLGQTIEKQKKSCFEDSSDTVLEKCKELKKSLETAKESDPNNTKIEENLKAVEEKIKSIEDLQNNIDLGNYSFKKKTRTVYDFRTCSSETITINSNNRAAVCSDQLNVSKMQDGSLKRYMDMPFCKKESCENMIKPLIVDQKTQNNFSSLDTCQAKLPPTSNCKCVAEGNSYKASCENRVTTQKYKSITVEEYEEILRSLSEDELNELKELLETKDFETVLEELAELYKGKKLAEE